MVTRDMQFLQLYREHELQQVTRVILC